MSSVTTKALRRALQRTVSCRRYGSSEAASSLASSSPASSSSQSSLDVKPQTKLPADKLRVLVSLYHQSATFITKENLSARIDEAFIYRPRRDVAYTTGPESSFKMLEAKVAERRALPKFGSLVAADTRAHHLQEGDTWSEGRDPRQRAVMTSLYGALARGKPGYEALEDEKERIKRQLQEDMQRKRR